MMIWITVAKKRPLLISGLLDKIINVKTKKQHGINREEGIEMKIHFLRMLTKDYISLARQHFECLEKHLNLWVFSSWKAQDAAKAILFAVWASSSHMYKSPFSVICTAQTKKKKKNIMKRNIISPDMVRAVDMNDRKNGGRTTNQI